MSKSKSKSIFVACTVGLSSFVFMACSSNVKKADIANTANPQQEIEKLNNELSEASAKNIDVLAADEYSDSAKWLKEAKADQTSAQPQEEILDNLRKSRGFLERAYVVSQNRAEKAPGLFVARQAAMSAGAAKHPELRDDLKSLDSDVSAKADSLAKISSEKLMAFQEGYVTLERKATVLNHLGNSQAVFNGLEKSKAHKLAPLTYKKADLALKNAESVISANVRNPESYRVAVATAVTDTTLLNDVMVTIKQNGKDLSESAALKMVAQNVQIKNLNNNLSNSNAESAALSDELQHTNQDLQSANVKNATQRAMESARTQFLPEEAEAYQQGANLLIRLKQVNFASGRSELPGDSIAILAKVSDVAKSMNASEIKIEGHTDSVGGVSQNKAISEKRAQAVATYFETNGFSSVKSEGYGFQKPIATNKSKEGRAQNRRVDIIISPAATTVAQ